MKATNFILLLLMMILPFFINAQISTIPSSSITKKHIINLNSPDRVPNQYIVVYKESALRASQDGNYRDGVSTTTQILADDSGSEILHIYDSAIVGAALYNTNQKQVANLLGNSIVKNIYADIYGQTLTTQTNPPFHLDRIDQEDFPLDYKYEYNTDGTGVNVYIIDSGIRPTHDGLSGKVASMKDFTEENGTNLENVDSIDGKLGHGTGVASVLGGLTYGVAKGVTLHSLKVFDQNGFTELSDIIAAINSVINQHTLPAVVNMSLGLGYTLDGLLPLQKAIDKMILQGITVVAASGNDIIEGCMFPAGFANVISVSATGYDTTLGYNDNRRWDGLYFGSNYGDCVDLYAPGENIETNSATDDSSIGTISGTSISSPQVAGAAALYLQNHPSATPSEVKSVIMNAATRNLIENSNPPYDLIPESQNYFLNVSGLMPDVYEDDDSVNSATILTDGVQFHNFIDDNFDMYKLDSAENVCGNSWQTVSCSIEFEMLSNPSSMELYLEYCNSDSILDPNTQYSASCLRVLQIVNNTGISILPYQYGNGAEDVLIVRSPLSSSPSIPVPNQNYKTITNCTCD